MSRISARACRDQGTPSEHARRPARCASDRRRTSPRPQPRQILPMSFLILGAETRKRWAGMSSAAVRLRLLDEARPTEGPPHERTRATMKYMLMMNHTGQGEFQVASWPKEDLSRHIQFMISFARKLGASGELVAAEGLGGPEQARLVRAGSDGKPITDGVFPESKEFLVGYWIVDVESPERAFEIAAEASAAPGVGGKPLNMAIEVRQVMSGPPPDSL